MLQTWTQQSQGGKFSGQMLSLSVRGWGCKLEGALSLDSPALVHSRHGKQDLGVLMVLVQPLGS